MMRPSQIFRSGDSRPYGKYDKYLGEWGHLGWAKHKGITSYALSANRQRPFAGAMNAAIFNTARRTRNQILYVAPPFILAYVVMQWAIERNEYLNSKAGIKEFGGAELTFFQAIFGKK